jgi:hypothetical protein
MGKRLNIHKVSWSLIHDTIQVVQLELAMCAKAGPNGLRVILPPTWDVH